MVGEIREVDSRVAERIESVRSYALSLYQRWPMIGLLMLYAGVWVAFRFVVLLFPTLSNETRGFLIFIMVLFGLITLSLLWYYRNQILSFVTFMGQLLSVLGYYLLGFAVSPAVFLFSKVLVIRGPRYRNAVACDPKCQTSNGKLCTVCDDLVGSSTLLVGSRWFFTRRANKYSHHLIDDLKSSADTCHLCRIFSDYFVDQRTFHNPSERLELRLQETRPFGKFPSLVIQNSADRRKDPPRLLIEEGESSIAPNTSCYLSWYGKAELKEEEFKHECDTAPCTDSDVVMHLARNWIDSCCSHSVCRLQKEADTPFIPTRLLDVQSGIVANLVDGSEIHPESEYIAFSHCWGEKEIPIKLQEHNMDAFESGIPIRELPKSFQHVIQIARAMQVGYVWIDSLCIIQDRTSDWEDESKRMGDVYKYALCVVSATASKDFNGGCFYKRRPLKSNSLCVLRSQGEKSIVVRSGVSDQEVINDLFHEYVDEAPLTKRGWTFQERVLGRRTLHFCNGVVLFECNYLRASQYHVDGVVHPKKMSIRTDGKIRSDDEVEALLPSTNRYVVVEQEATGTTGASGGGRSFRYTERIVVENPAWQPPEEREKEFFSNSAISGQRGDFQLLLHFEGTEAAELIEFHNSWYTMVEEYSKRTLKYSTDKVPALDGVASTIRKATGFEYLTGLWRESIAFDLLWAVDHDHGSQPKPVRTSPPNVDVPTWSWVSIDGVIQNPLKPSAEADNQGILYTTDTFKTAWADARPLLSLDETYVTESDGTPDRGPGLSVSGSLCEFGELPVTFVADLLDKPLDYGSLRCLPLIAFTNSYVGLYQGDPQVHGIVVRQKSSQFERVGYFHMKDSQAVQDIVHRSRCKVNLI